jgi:hypothetical protein
MKFVSRLRSRRRDRPAKPEYAMTGILVGIFSGWIVGFGLELVYGNHMLLMMGTALAGLLLGAGFEAIRFRWRMRRFCSDKQSKPHLTS